MKKTMKYVAALSLTFALLPTMGFGTVLTRCLPGYKDVAPWHWVADPSSSWILFVMMVFFVILIIPHAGAERDDASLGRRTEREPCTKGGEMCPMTSLPEGVEVRLGVVGSGGQLGDVMTYSPPQGRTAIFLVLMYLALHFTFSIFVCGMGAVTSLLIAVGIFFFGCCFCLCLGGGSRTLWLGASSGVCGPKSFELNSQTEASPHYFWEYGSSKYDRNTRRLQGSVQVRQTGSSEVVRFGDSLPLEVQRCFVDFINCHVQGRSSAYKKTSCCHGPIWAAAMNVQTLFLLCAIAASAYLLSSYEKITVDGEVIQVECGNVFLGRESLKRASTTEAMEVVRGMRSGELSISERNALVAFERSRQLKPLSSSNYGCHGIGFRDFAVLLSLVAVFWAIWAIKGFPYANLSFEDLADYKIHNNRPGYWEGDFVQRRI